MLLRGFSLAAIALIVFAIAATANTTLTFLHVTWTSWLCAAILSWFVGKFLDGFTAT